MRSIFLAGICTLGMNLQGTTAQAFDPFEGQDFDPFSEEACYGRIYSVEHMNANPEQAVSALSVKFAPEDEENYMHLSLQMTAARRAWSLEFSGITFSSAPACAKAFLEQNRASEYGVEDSLLSCAIDCDGGQVHVIEADAQTLLIQSAYLVTDEASVQIEEGACAGSEFLMTEADLAAGDDVEYVSYRLYRMPKEACAE